jgi:hypothetical protein
MVLNAESGVKNLKKRVTNVPVKYKERESLKKLQKL